jgi:hypothetical protein
MAHEIAHEDLGHVAELQLLGAGLSLGSYLLEQLLPGSGVITPIAGTLIARGYSRREEYEADSHGVEILRRAGYSPAVLINALTWVAGSSGGNGGGFLSTHPATKAAPRVRSLLLRLRFLLPGGTVLEAAQRLADGVSAVGTKPTTTSSARKAPSHFRGFAGSLNLSCPPRTNPFRIDGLNHFPFSFG